MCELKTKSMEEITLELTKCQADRAELLETLKVIAAYNNTFDFASYGEWE